MPAPPSCANGGIASPRDSATHDGTRRDAEHARARAEAAVANAEERIARADRESTRLVERETALGTERDGCGPTSPPRPRARQRHATRSPRCTRPMPPTARDLTEAERAATTARERLRAADERARAADHAELEARLGLESLREGVLVELAGLRGARVRRAWGSSARS